MYTSPIEAVSNNMRIEYEDSIMKAIQDACVEVNKQELIRALQYDRDQYEKGFADSLRWISLKDKHPKRFENVLCFFPEKDYGSKIAVSYNESDYNYHFADTHRFGKPTHWMPLPAPPTEKED